ncbi:MAG: hypothetical protein ABJF10_17125 [Chthoniobacter sp.]|uniref:hypothetical protein n=1 Tax=Chthoniobacter sp. TaxID=2510640 RepID=UPI0032A7432B
MATDLLPVTGFGQALAAPAVPVAAAPSAENTRLRREEAEREQAIIHAKWNVCVDLQMVALEEAKAMELIPEFQSENEVKIEAAWRKLQVMIKTREATLLAWPMVRTVDGSRAVSETIVEKRYPTEFEPPHEPRTFGPPIPEPGHINEATVEGTPNAFETRNTGVTLEVEPTVLSQGKRIYLRLEPSRTELLRMEDYGPVLTVHNTLISAPQPLFASPRTHLDLTVRSGQRQLIAAHKLTKPVNCYELDIVRAVVTKAE